MTLFEDDAVVSGESELDRQIGPADRQRTRADVTAMIVLSGVLRIPLERVCHIISFAPVCQGKGLLLKRLH